MNRLALPPPLAEHLRDSHWRVLVTGAGGWLGQAALELLADALGPDWRTRVAAFGSEERLLVLRDGSEIRQQPLAMLPRCPRQPSLLLHFAYLTREKASRMPAETYIATNRALSHLVAEGGAAIGVERAFVTSSGAAHAALATADDADPGLLYGKLKLEDEALFEQFALAEPGRRALVARLFNLSGPYINKPYALASFIDQAARGKRIQVRAMHPVVRSYTSVSNLLGVAMGQLLADHAPPFRRVETAGDHEVEVGELARMVRDLVSPDAIIERAECMREPIDRYVGDGAEYRRLMAGHGIAEHALARQIADTAEYLAQLEPAQP
ncbi:MAG TPA: NAD-dependent epimerase/dehydratase family protein [Thermomonas sp.]|nr:NAD-dependent epimerase/dehydratase family protein [Thermomonas sp.]